MFLLSCFLVAASTLVNAQGPPTLYEYYTDNGVTEGLTADNSIFTLNTLPITLYSGSIHYYRIHPDYWRDRLRKARALGLNAIETYVPWNLHEPQKGVFDFGDGGNEFSALLDVRRFLQIAQEEDLFVIFRPGPYVCGEFDFGGLPSWLLRYPGIQVRTSDPIFITHMQQFFTQLISQVVDLQFVRGGPIIAVQVENEYGAFGPPDTLRDQVYLDLIRASYHDNGIDELLFTCDTPANSSDIGALPGYLQMANFNTDPEVQFDLLLELQPGKPLMAMEYWSGWYDHWFDPQHNTGNSPQNFARYLSTIFSYNASVNFYMFHGGSSFGFLNGANVYDTFPFYLPDISSYDYDAPLSEAGDYTEKYQLAKELIAVNNPVVTLLPDQPPQSAKSAYPAVQVTDYLSYQQIIDQVPSDLKLPLTRVTSMEALDMNNGNGQSFGLVVYRKSLTLGSTSQLHVGGHVRDIALVLVDGEQKTSAPVDMSSLNGFGFWPASDANFTLSDVTPGDHVMDLVIDNLGRTNFGYPADYDARKGLFEGLVLVDDVEFTDITAIPLELKGSWVQSLTGWTPATPGEQLNGPVMLRTTLSIPGEPTDTFLDMSSWVKGSIFVNGFSLGRYFNVGPQKTNYIPAPLLNQGENEIIIFEHYVATDQVTFTDAPILG